jgi:hypothetical protein
MTFLLNSTGIMHDFSSDNQTFVIIGFCVVVGFILLMMWLLLSRITLRFFGFRKKQKVGVVKGGFDRKD